MSAAVPTVADIPAPAIREDLRLVPSLGGAQLIYDPVVHRYHELDAETVAILARWRVGEPLGSLAVRLSADLGTQLGAEDLYDIAKVFDQVGLLVEPMLGWRFLLKQKEAGRHGALLWLLHNYLFIRIPLVRPNRFLIATLPFARLFWSPIFLACVSVMGLTGVYLTSRQWDAFTYTFFQFISIDGAICYLAALISVKVLHEAGHAYTARHFGCRVPTMGVAFLVLAPVLYTDVTDVWRLPSRRQRMLVGAGGLLTELALAAVALFLWALLPDGIARSTCFFVATTSLATSFAINLSPMMRFDGYYLLSDLCGISNLQPRAFALMRWSIREALFGLGDPCPEDWSHFKRIAVLVYAAATCVYRLGLFIAIALLVYHLTFKILGIVLFGIEIMWFVLRPVFHEFRVWWAMRARITAQNRSLAALAGGLGIVTFAFVPWAHRLEIPAVLEPIAMQRLTSPVGARITAITARNGDTVVPGDVLLRLESPKLQSDMVATRISIDLARLRRDRRVVDRLDREATLTLEQELASLSEKIDGLTRLEEQLTIRAAVEGQVADLPPDLHEGRWIGKGEELGFVVAALGWQVRGYLTEEALHAVPVAATGVFVPDEPLTMSLSVHLASIGTTGVEWVDLPYLASTFGGDVPVGDDRQGHGVPVKAQYQFVAKLQVASVERGPVLRGVVLLNGYPDSFATRFVQNALAVLIRESGF